MPKNELTLEQMARANEYIQKAQDLDGDALAELNDEYRDIIDLVTSIMTDSDADPNDSADLLRVYIATHGRQKIDFVEIPKRTVKKVTDADYPIDKINHDVWNLLGENTHGQRTFDIRTGPKNQKAPEVTYSINFDEIKSNFPIVKRLTAFDKRVYIAAGALYDAGNAVMTLTQLYYAMGYNRTKGGPSTKALEKIDASLTKLSARITLDNEQEVKSHYDYPYFCYDGDLLSFERIRELTQVNGKLVDAQIHILNEPPLLDFARGRDQLTTIPAKMLQSPLSKTELNLNLEDYLIERIARAKNAKKHQEKITFATVFEHLHLDAKKDKAQRSRVKNTKIPTCLDHFKDCGQIVGYTVENDKVIVKLASKN